MDFLEFFEAAGSSRSSSSAPRPAPRPTAPPARSGSTARPAPTSRPASGGAASRPTTPTTRPASRRSNREAHDDGRHHRQAGPDHDAERESRAFGRRFELARVAREYGPQPRVVRHEGVGYRADRDTRISGGSAIRRIAGLGSTTFTRTTTSCTANAYRWRPAFCRGKRSSCGCSSWRAGRGGHRHERHGFHGRTAHGSAGSTCAPDTSVAAATDSGAARSACTNTVNAAGAVQSRSADRCAHAVENDPHEPAVAADASSAASRDARRAARG